MKKPTRRFLLTAVALLPVAAIAKRKTSQAKSKKHEETITPQKVSVVFPAGEASISSRAESSLQAIAKNKGSFLVIGRGDGEYEQGLAQLRAGRIRERIIAHGVPPDSIICVEEPPQNLNKSSSEVIFREITVPNVAKFAVLPGEMELRQVITRWGAESGWRVNWTSQQVVPAFQPSRRLPDDFILAAHSLLEQANAMGHALKGEAFTNRVLCIS